MLTALLAILAALAIAATAFVIGMRAKSPLVLGPIVALSRRVLNPRQLRRAGQPGAFASIIRHRGRRTGRLYETPVGVIPDGDAFLIALVYGPRTQWLRNVLASGEAILVTEGRTYPMGRPEVVSSRSVIHRFSRSDQLAFRLMATDDCLRLHRAAGAADTTALDAAAA